MTLSYLESQLTRRRVAWFVAREWFHMALDHLRRKA